LALWVVAGFVQQGAPGSANGRDNHVIEVAGHIVFGDRYERIGQPDWGHIVLFGCLNNVDERLIEAAMAQGNQDTLGSAETSLAAAAMNPAVIGLWGWLHRALL
jgi:hypothetical protein